MVEGVLCQFGDGAVASGNSVKESALHNAIQSVGGLEDALAGGSGEGEAHPHSFLEVHAAEIDHCFSQPDIPSIQAAVRYLPRVLRHSLSFLCDRAWRFTNDRLQ
eukprot:COSAG06_NODE_4_length_41837_cov_204.557597_22_plen_105_part_00